MSFEDDVRDELRALEAAQLRRVPRVLDGRQGARIVVDGAEVTSFASNDYLGLAGDPRIARAASRAVEEFGVGAGASRLIIGNHREHVLLEETLASWMRSEGATLFNTGFAANVGVLTALLRAGDMVFSDELNHASIIDGCRLSRAEVRVFPHRDLRALEGLLHACPGRRRIVVSESVFSMDGDVADVVALAALCRAHDAVFVLDEAHALGVLGPEGRGVAAMHEVVPDVLIGTFGKALGTAGAFAASSRAVAQLLWNRARPLVFSTGFPPAIAAATRVAIEVVRGAEGDSRRAQLQDLRRRWNELTSSLRCVDPEVRAAPSSAESEVRAAKQRVVDSTPEVRAARVGPATSTMTPAAANGTPMGDSGASNRTLETPIAPLVLGVEQRVVEVANRLLKDGLLVAAVRPPTVPRGTSRLRISFSASHSQRDVEFLASTLQRVIGES